MLRTLRSIRGLAVSGVALASVCAASTVRAGPADQTAAVLHSAESAPAPVGSRLVVLGTIAGPVADGDRSEPANLIEVGDRKYLIDAGEGVAQRLAAAGVQASDVRRIFLTHLHFDHVAGLAPLLGFAWIKRAGGEIDIYGPPATEAFVDSALHYLAIPQGIFATGMPPTPRLSEIVRAHDIDVSGPTVIYEDDSVRVTAVENTHYVMIPDDRRPLGAARSYAYRFDTPDRSIVFTGDTGPSDAVIALAQGADILVSEVQDTPTVLAALTRAFNAPEAALKPIIDHMVHQHLSPQEVGLMAQRAGVKMVVLTHIGGANRRTDMRVFTDGVREAFSGPIVAARDGDAF